MIRTPGLWPLVAAAAAVFTPSAVRADGPWHLFEPALAPMPDDVPEVIDVKMPDGTVVKMDLEEYVKGVLPKEIGTSFPIEAAKAQAVAARTYAVIYVLTKGPICTTTQCQVWGEKRYPATDDAVDATRGVVATSGGMLAGTFYSASCGGHTQDVEDVWTEPLPHLRGVPCIENKLGLCDPICAPDEPASATCWGVYGHRVGLCQRGAEAMGLCGSTYEEILSHYYTGIELVTTGSAPAEGAVPDASEGGGEDGAAEGEAEEAMPPEAAPEAKEGIAEAQTGEPAGIEVAGEPGGVVVVTRSTGSCGAGAGATGLPALALLAALAATRRRRIPAAVAALLLAAACAGTDAAPGDAAPEAAPDATADASLEAAPDPAPDPIPDPAPEVGPPRRVSEAFDARPTVEQVYVWNAVPGTEFEVVAHDGTVAGGGVADDLGALVVRGVPPGPGYAVRPKAAPDDYTGPLTVWSIDGSKPPDSFYSSQTFDAGYGYITMRDGTKLSMFVTLPGPPDQGPYPTIVSYSGYSPSRPGRSLGSEVEPLCEAYPVLCDAPDDPSNLIAALYGFATVGVNMRGTGCSGGAYDYFEPLQSLDGYDVVEIVARQAWVKDHVVGMVGLSFPGIAQLFVGAVRPPSLVAIAPQSVIADSASSCLIPGGIYNDGFAFSWHDMVLDAALPYHHGWVKDVIAAGDALCDDNQELHGQQRDAIEEALLDPWYTDEVAKPVDPSAWADRIGVPVFLTGQWQDEQTGPHFAALLDKFTGAPARRFVVTNGVHDDGFSPQDLVEWLDYIFLFVAEQVPPDRPDLRALGSVFMEKTYGASMPIAESAFSKYLDLASAMAAWQARPEVRVIFETGAAPGVTQGAPQGTFSREFESWPIPGTVASRWWFRAGGALAAQPPPADGGASAFDHDPEAGQKTCLASGSVRTPQPAWDWQPLVPGKAVAFVTGPLASDVVLIGHGSADLWIRVDAEDADLEVNLSEVRPDGKESYVQSGWLRASHRTLREDATELRPIKTHRKEDAQPLVPGEWTYARVEIMPHAHVFRAGSRLRLSVDTPGGSRADWRFRLLEFDHVPRIEVGHDAEHPSSVALPLVPGVDVPTDLPPCTALRGQMCRDYATPR